MPGWTMRKNAPLMPGGGWSLLELTDALQLEQISFITEIKNPDKTDLHVCEPISLQTMSFKFCLNVGVKRGSLTTSSIMEI